MSIKPAFAQSKTTNAVTLAQPTKEELAQPYTQKKVESWTGVEYEPVVQIDVADEQKCYKKQFRLLGPGLRCMLGMCFLPFARAYSFGLYVDDSVFTQIVSNSKMQQYPMEDCMLTNFETAILNDSFDKSLRLVFVQPSQAAVHVADGFEKSIGKRLLTLHATDEEREKAQDALVQMKRRLMKEKNFNKDTMLDLTWCKGGLLVVAINNAPVMTLSSLPLCKAVFSVYCGADAVSPSSKALFEKTWNEMIGKKE